MQRRRGREERDTRRKERGRIHMHTHASCVTTVRSQFPAVTSVLGTEFRWKVLAAGAFIILITFSEFSIISLHLRSPF